MLCAADRDKAVSPARTPEGRWRPALKGMRQRRGQKAASDSPSRSSGKGPPEPRHDARDIGGWSDGRNGRILFSSLMGQGAHPFVDALGCLRSLRARSALDGVSWMQRGSVEIAVGRVLAAATQSAPSSAPSFGRRSLRELDAASCPIGLWA